jgi:hypothetical protein
MQQQQQQSSSAYWAPAGSAPLGAFTGVVGPLHHSDSAALAEFGFVSAAASNEQLLASAAWEYAGTNLLPANGVMPQASSFSAPSFLVPAAEQRNGVPPSWFAQQQHKPEGW